MLKTDWFIRRIAQVYKSSIYFSYIVAIRTKMADKVGLLLSHYHCFIYLYVLGDDSLIS